jgi:hypothetical protein
MGEHGINWDYTHKIYLEILKEKEYFVVSCIGWGTILKWEGGSAVG